jgi:transposase InsO family protein
VSRLHGAGYPVAALCETLEVSRSAYYAWEQDVMSTRSIEDYRLRPLIRKLFWEHKRRYGARRLAEELAEDGYNCSRRRVSRLMKDMDLVAIQPRTFRPRTTDSRHTLGYSDNLLIDAPPPTSINQVWVGDITYIPLCSSKFAYLAMLMDLFSRRIVGWALHDNMQETLSLAALRQAQMHRHVISGLIHHTDRGGQYAGKSYRRELARLQMKQSMSRADNCYDNCFMESCFGTIKSELEMNCYRNLEIATNEISDYIRYYNIRRRHSSLGYQAPEAFEAGRN